MTLIIRQIRALIAEAPLRKKHDNKTSEQQNRRKSLSVKISKEPPAVVYFTRDKLEESFECIFDPQVHHDSETDHPDLLFAKTKTKDPKPWLKAPYCTASNKNPTFLARFKSSFRTTPMAEPVA